MKKNPNIVIRKVTPASFLVDITKCYNNRNETLLEIDEMGCMIWNSIHEGSSNETVLHDFLELLSDEKTEEFVCMVRQDVNDFINILILNHCIIGEDEQ